MDVVGLIFDLLVPVVLAFLILAYPIYVCFQKGKPVFASLGIIGIFPPLALFTGWFALVGALRLAKPDSSWAKRRYASQTMDAASRRFGKTSLPRPDSGIVGSAVGEEGLSSLRRTAIMDFLFEAEARGILDHATYQKLVAFLGGSLPAPVSQPAAPPVATQPVVAQPTPPLITPPKPAPAPQVTVPLAPPPAPPVKQARERRPSVWKARLGKLGEAIVSELAVHGFVYFGVLLTFVGVFGFLFFSFKDVPDNAQPFVELLIPLVFFVWAWVLHRRQAMLIFRGMELLGGLVLPIVVFAGLVDNAPIPPDFQGGALIAAMVIVSLLIAFGYAWWSAKHQDSALAYLVAPLTWLGGLVLGFVFKTDEPLVGVAITRFVSFQPAVAAAVIAATLAAVTLRPAHRLARPCMLAAVPGVTVAYALMVGLTVGEGSVHSVPILLAGVSTLLSVELLGRYFAQTKATAALRPLLLAATLAPLIPIWGLAWTGVAMVVSYLAVLEWDLKSGEAIRWGVTVAIAGAAVGLVLSVLEPWPMVVAFAVASLWSHTRRVVGLPMVAGSSLAVAAAILPFGLGYGLLGVLPDDVAWLVMSGIIVSVVGGVRWLRSDDRFWADWPMVAASAVALGATATWYPDQGAATSPTMVVIAITLAAVALAGSSQWPALRVWLTTGALALAMGVGLDGGNVAQDVRPVVWAFTGVAVVIAAALWRRGVAGHLGLVGHLIGLGSLLATPRQRLVDVLGAWTIAWLATVIAGEVGGAGASDLLQKFGRRFESQLGERMEAFGKALPQFVLAASAPFAVLETAALWERFSENRAWSGVTLGVLAIAYAACARRMIQRKPLPFILASGAALLSVIGVAVAAPEPWESIWTAASSIVVAAVLAGELRRSAFTWFAWMMSGVLIVLLANRVGIPGRSLDLVALGWGGLLLIGGLVFDDLRSGRRQPGEGLRIAWVRYPVVLGALAVPMSLGPTFSQGPDVFGWWSLATGAGYFVVAYLLRVGAVTGPAYALTAVAIAVLTPQAPMDRPWLFAVAAGALVGCSFVAERLRARSGGGEGWLRWDLPPLVVAHLVAGVALARAAQIAEVPWTAVGFGLLSIVVSVWRGNRIWAEAGNILLLVGAAGFGPQWLALALLATSIRAVVSALLTTEVTRISYQVMAAVAAGWSFVQVIVWQGWAVPEAVAVASLVFGGLAVVVAALVSLTGLTRDWVATWGGLAVLGMFITTAAAPGYIDDVRPAAGMALFAFGLGLAARPMRSRILEVSATLTTGVAWLELIAGAGWDVDRAVGITSLAAGGLALLVALLVRYDLLSRSWATIWGVLSLLAVISVGGFVWLGSFGLAPSIGTALFAVGLGLGGRPLRLKALEAWVTLAVGVAWLELIAGARWEVEVAVTTTSLAAGGLALVLALWARFLRLSRSWATSWGVLALFSLLVVSPYSLVMSRTFAGTTPAIGLGLFAIACAIGARPLAGWLHYLTIGTSVWAWTVLAPGLGWSIETTSFWTALAFGGLAVVVTETGRIWPRSPTDPKLRIYLARTWIVVAAVGVGVATLLAIDSLANRSVWLAAGAAMGMVAIATARAAVPLQWSWLRETSGLMALSSVTALAYGFEASAAGIAIGTMSVGVAATATLLILGHDGVSSPWLQPLIITGTVANFEAFIIAVSLLPEREVLVAVVLAFGVQAIAVGLVLDRPGVLSIGPPLVCIAWLGIASESFTGSAQWYTAPVAVTLLAEVEIARWSSRRGRQALSPGQIRILEWAGIGLLSLAPLAEMFTGGVGYGLLAFGYSAVVLIWAIMTKVRRRVVAALVLATVAAALTISAAAAGAAPTSAFFWIFAAGAGLAVMLSIGIVESYRSRSGAVMRRLDVLMEGWE